MKKNKTLPFLAAMTLIVSLLSGCAVNNNDAAVSPDSSAGNDAQTTSLASAETGKVIEPPSAEADINSAAPQPDDNHTTTPDPEPQPTATPNPQAVASPELQTTPTQKPQPTATPEPQSTPTPKPQPTATPEPQSTPTPKPQPTATPLPQTASTPTPQPTATPEPQATATPEPAVTSGKINVTKTGGTGRSTISSPASFSLKNGTYYARIVWSSPNYTYMIVGGEKYTPVNKEGNSTFEIPIKLDTDMTVTACTVAMSAPHEIEYVLHFDSSSIKKQ